MQKRYLTFAVSALIGVAIGSSALAEERSQQEIIEGLATKKPLTRSIGAKPSMKDGDSDFLNSLGNSRGIKFTINKNVSQDEYKPTDYKEPTYEKEEIAKVAKITQQYDLPKLDFEIKFEFGSASVSGESLSQVINLAKALADPSLANTRVILGGHTDAKGSDAFNQILSQKRSDAVAHLVAKIGDIDPGRLVPIGYGEHELKNKVDPNADENRRVEVINITAY